MLSAAIHYCRQQNAKLVIDWNDGCYSDSGDSFWKAFRLVNCEDILAEDQNPSSLNNCSTQQTAWQGKFHQQATPIFQQIKEQTNHKGEDFHQIPSLSALSTMPYTINGNSVAVICGYKRKQTRAMELLKHLRLSPEFSEKLHTDISSFQTEQIKNAPYVGIHVRSSCEGHFEKPDYQRIKQFVNKRYRQPRIFLATDTSAEIERAEKIFGKQLIIQEKIFPDTSNKQYSTEPFALHKIDNENQTHPVDKLNVLYEAIRDIHLLSISSELYVQIGSTFSELAMLYFQQNPLQVRPNRQSPIRQRCGILWRSALRSRMRINHIVPSRGWISSD